MEMQRNDSSSVISSLQMDYGDSDEEENDSRNNSHTEEAQTKPSETEVKKEPSPEEKREEAKASVPVPEPEPMAEVKTEMKEEVEVSPVDFISDDDDDNHPGRKHHHHHHHHHRHHKHSTDSSKESSRDVHTKRAAVSESLATDSPASQDSSKPEKKARRLVSYGPDEDVEDEESSEEEDIIMEASNADSPALNASDASILSRSVQNMANDDIQIPPEPPGKCPSTLQKDIEDMYDRMGTGLNRVIQTKKNFRNPSIYEKLIDFCHIDEKGTNFPVEIYDPHIWGKESFYDELDKAQRKDMERREKEKKERTKIEFMTGTKKPSTQTDGAPEEKKRKTKWDAQPGNIQVQYTKLPSASQNPGVANLTAIATGTKATVIPALGSLSKKTSSSK